MGCLLVLRRLAGAILVALLMPAARPAAITSAGQPAQLDIRPAGAVSVRVTLRPVESQPELPYSPALVEREWPAPVISLRSIDAPIEQRVGNLRVTVRPDPLTVLVAGADGEPINELTFDASTGNVSFAQHYRPILGMGEGGPRMGPNWRNERIELDRRGRYHEMVPRWQSQAYGSRNPVPLLIGTEGWGIFVATPWVHVDLEGEDRGLFVPWKPPAPPQPGERRGRGAGGNYVAQIQGRPPVESIVPGVYDIFVFDARQPEAFMKDVAELTGPAVLPPRWSLGYMQSHRELRDDTMDSEQLMLWVVDTFREKRIPLDTVIYLGTGFTPTGWNTRQPSFEFNPAVFKRDPKEVIADLHARHVKVVLHMVPPPRNELPTLHGNIPPREGETVDESHILTYWRRHIDLFNTPIDGWWPDEGDWFNLWERMTRHKLYYQGPLYTRPNVRPWSLHRNGYLGIARWGGWVWSGDTNATWKTLEGQIAVGLNHSLSLSPYWGSDTGGFYTTSELTGELYARWFQFSAFCPSFRSHGRIWRLRLPWGWGLSSMGFLEGQNDPPLESELNNPAIEPICRKYAELRYQLMPYTYTLARQARDTGMPFMRAMWLHYPQDPRAVELGDQYLWGRDLLIAPVYQKGATARRLYLPEGRWYDWWTLEAVTGGRFIERPVDLATMPIYARAGAVIPFDPVRQYLDEPVSEPTTIKVFRGADGEFTLYEDDGNSLAYLENRGTTWTRLAWNDAARTLSIAPAPPAGVQNAPVDRTFRVQLLPDDRVREVRYRNQPVDVKF